MHLNKFQALMRELQKFIRGYITFTSSYNILNKDIGVSAPYPLCVLGSVLSDPTSEAWTGITKK
jgi:hypothetical protein